jgi:GNAT superfamily N-acetyltransferase
MFRMHTTPNGTPLLVVTDRPGLAWPRVTVRPLCPGETGPLERVFDGLSPRSRYLRFLAPVPRLTTSTLQQLTDVDHVRHGSWVAQLGSEPVGIGRWVRPAGTVGLAEIALEVVDDHHGQGFGRLLLDVVGAAAAEAGIGSLLWLMDEGNQQIRRLAVPLGGDFTAEDGVVEATTPLPPVDELDAAHVARAARAARARVRTSQAA